METKRFSTMSLKERINMMKNSKNLMLKRMAIVMEQRMKMIESAKTKDE
jgi:hypothetical protein